MGALLKIDALTKTLTLIMKSERLCRDLWVKRLVVFLTSVQNSKYVLIYPKVNAMMLYVIDDTTVLEHKIHILMFMGLKKMSFSR